MKSSHKLKRHRPRRTLPVSYLQVTSQLSHNTTRRAARATTQPADPAHRTKPEAVRCTAAS
jgi:hypothetical protein